MFHCTKCSDIFSSKLSLKAHVATMHGGTDLQCPLCSKLSISKDALLRHLLECTVSVQTGDADIVCVFCGDTFVDTEDFRIHIKVRFCSKGISAFFGL